MWLTYGYTPVRRGWYQTGYGDTRIIGMGYWAGERWLLCPGGPGLENFGDCPRDVWRGITAQSFWTNYTATNSPV